MIRTGNQTTPVQMMPSLGVEESSLTYPNPSSSSSQFRVDRLITDPAGGSVTGTTESQVVSAGNLTDSYVTGVGVCVRPVVDSVGQAHRVSFTGSFATHREHAIRSTSSLTNLRGPVFFPFIGFQFAISNVNTSSVLAPSRWFVPPHYSSDNGWSVNWAASLQPGSSTSFAGSDGYILFGCAYVYYSSGNYTITLPPSVMSFHVHRHLDDRLDYDPTRI